MTSRYKVYCQIETIAGYFDFDSQMFGFLDNLANWYYVKYIRKENMKEWGLSPFHWAW